MFDRITKTVMKLITILGIAMVLFSCSTVLLNNGEISGVNNSIPDYISPSDLQNNPVLKYGMLYTSGNRIVDARGNAVQLRGMSMFWSTLNWGAEKWWTNINSPKLVASMATNYGANILRAAMGVDETGGYLSQPAYQMLLMTNFIDACIANGVYVIVDYHTHTGYTNLTAATNFFVTIANKYKNVPNVIFEPFNEPLSISWSSVIKPFVSNVIVAIRATGANNLVSVGTPNWSQDVDVATLDPLPHNTTTFTNVAYTLHFYADSHKQWLRDKADTALSRGYALFVTEYGTCDASGNGGYNPTESSNWFVWMNSNKISSCNWSINHKNETASAFVTNTNVIGPWVDAELSASGKLVRDWMRGLNPYTESFNTNIPGMIRAVSFKQQSGIITEGCLDTGAGSDVGWIDAGDWLDYGVVVPVAGTYTVDFRLAAPATGKTLVLKEGANTLATISVPNTGGWQTWQSVQTNVTFSTAGAKTLRVETSTGGFNFNYMNYYSPIPGKVESEAFSLNSGGTNGVCGDTGGGMSVGWFNVNDYLDYSVNVATAGNYDVVFRVQSGLTTGAFDLKSGSTTLASVTVPNTGWNAWTNVTGTVTLAAGLQTLRLSITGGGFNINYMQFNSAAGGGGGSGNETISNAGFETGSLGIWQQSGGSVVGTGAYAGTYCAKITGTQAYVYQSLILSSNTTYVIEAYAKADSGDTVELKAEKFNGATSVNDTTTSASYVKKTVTFTTGLTNTGGQVTFIKWNAGANSGYADAFTLWKSPVLNPNFETGALGSWNNGMNGSVITTAPYAGTYCVQIAGTQAYVHQTVTGLQANTAYTVTAMLKADTGNTIELKVENFGGTAVSTTSTATAWTSVSRTFTTGSTNTTAQITFIKWNNGAGNGYGDNFILTKN